MHQTDIKHFGFESYTDPETPLYLAGAIKRMNAASYFISRASTEDTPKDIKMHYVYAAIVSSRSCYYVLRHSLPKPLDQKILEKIHQMIPHLKWVKRLRDETEKEAIKLTEVVTASDGKNELVARVDLSTGSMNIDSTIWLDEKVDDGDYKEGKLTEQGRAHLLNTIIEKANILVSNPPPIDNRQIVIGSPPEMVGSIEELLLRLKEYLDGVNEAVVFLKNKYRASSS